MPLLNDKLTWVLADHRVGSTKQAIALADQLSTRVEIKKISYNKWGFLPNILLQHYPIHIKNLTQLLQSQPKPELLIAAGRKSAALSVYLKNIWPDLHNIQLLRPELAYHKFSAVALPKHDLRVPKNADIIRYSGALVDTRLKAADFHNFDQIYPELDKFIAVIIGGDTKNYQFTADSLNAFIELLKQITAKYHCPLFISYSRRTPLAIKLRMNSEFNNKINLIYDPLIGLNYNPYPIMLYKAEHIIITGDSISMLSEAASSGKPTHIFTPANFTSAKHLLFMQQLINEGVALPLSEPNLAYYSYQPLNELKKTATSIVQKLALR